MALAKANMCAAAFTDKDDTLNSFTCHIDWRLELTVINELQHVINKLLGL